MFTSISRQTHTAGSGENLLDIQVSVCHILKHLKDGKRDLFIFITLSVTSFSFSNYSVHSLKTRMTSHPVINMKGGLALLLVLVFIPILHGSLTGGLALARRSDILTSVTSSFCYGLK